jgi:hypothetical protein
MEWFIVLISIVWIAAGGFLILYTERCRDLMVKVFAQMGRVPMAVAAALVGILLLLSARSSVNPGVVVFLGLIALAKGGVFFWNPNDLFDKTRQWWLESATDQTYRLTGTISLILGTALISWI